MIPFAVQLRPGSPVYEQVIFAVHKALVTGQLKAGDAFPSVRALSKELKINPNTVLKVVAHLKQDGLLVVEPGRGTFIGEKQVTSEEDREALLGTSVEALVVEARKLHLTLDEVMTAVQAKWEKFKSS
jgi:GntR family transcriptional regulator